MGAWGHDTFENDTACDWTYDLTEQGFPLIERTLEKVLRHADSYLDSDVACEGLAAADVVARMKGRFGQCDSYTEELDSWVRAQSQTPSDELESKAVKAINRILGQDSELAELWEESGANDSWKSSVVSLRQRLTLE